MSNKNPAADSSKPRLARKAGQEFPNDLPIMRTPPAEGDSYSSDGIAVGHGAEQYIKAQGKTYGVSRSPTEYEYYERPMPEMPEEPIEERTKELTPTKKKLPRSPERNKKPQKVLAHVLPHKGHGVLVAQGLSAVAEEQKKRREREERE